jgi:hypothetical protein
MYHPGQKFQHNPEIHQNSFQGMRDYECQLNLIHWNFINCISSNIESDITFISADILLNDFIQFDAPVFQTVN